jgi:hypothetical protein
MDDKEKRFVDELLDASLRRYATAEPRPGLEGRVLAGVRSRQQAARRRAAWTWAMGMAAVAAVVALLVIYRPRQQPVPFPVTAKGSAHLSTPVVAKVAPLAQPSMLHLSRRPAAPGRVDTRPQQFPTPRPLSEQEKLLLIYAQSLQGASVASALKADADFNRELEIPPIRIEAIKIEPLAPPEEIGDDR